MTDNSEYMTTYCVIFRLVNENIFMKCILFEPYSKLYHTTLRLPICHHFIVVLFSSHYLL